MKKTISIVAVEDDETYIDVLRQVFADHPGFELAQGYRNPVAFLGALPGLRCDVILLDLRMPKVSGVECIRQIKEFAPGAKVVILTVHDDDDLVLHSFLEGADGYLLKESTPRQIRQAIEDAVKGGAPMSASIARKVLRILEAERDARPRSVQGAAVQGQLSRRELEILQWLSTGRKYAEIAEGLCISLDTVKTHVHNIYRKLEVRNKAEAIARFLKD